MSMSKGKLEDLVPPLGLCKLIPAGAFQDSALMWNEDESFPDAPAILSTRDNMIFTEGWRNTPAPTLAEILEADHRMTITRSHTGITWAAEVWDGSRWYARNDINSATAALKLWFLINGVEVEK